jgi:hypothetical protein
MQMLLRLLLIAWYMKWGVIVLSGSAVLLWIDLKISSPR